MTADQAIERIRGDKALSDDIQKLVRVRRFADEGDFRELVELLTAHAVLFGSLEELRERLEEAGP